MKLDVLTDSREQVHVHVTSTSQVITLKSKAWGKSSWLRQWWLLGRFCVDHIFYGRPNIKLGTAPSTGFRGQRWAGPSQCES